MKTRRDELRALAQRRLQRISDPMPEEWARQVEEARRRGYHLLRFPGLIVEVRDYSLTPDDDDGS